MQAFCFVSAVSFSFESLTVYQQRRLSQDRHPMDFPFEEFMTLEQP